MLPSTFSSFLGAMHDKSAIEYSPKFLRFLEELPSDKIVLGDAAYRGVHPQLIVPFTGTLSDEEMAFNERHSSLRQVVERSIGALENKWRILQLKENKHSVIVLFCFAFVVLFFKS